MNKKSLKLLCFLLTFIASILIATCVFANNSSNTQTLPELSTTLVNPLHKSSTYVESNKFYSNSSESAVKSYGTTYTSDKFILADYVRTGMENRIPVFTIPYYSTYVLSQSDFDNLIDDLFELSLSETGIPTQGDYLRYNWIQLYTSAKIGTDGVFYYYDITFNFNYYTTKKQEDELTAEVNALLRSFNFDEDTTDKEKIDTIYEYITSNITYDYDNLYDESYLLKFTPYAALMHKTTVCQGYAVLFYRLTQTLRN